MSERERGTWVGTVQERDKREGKSLRTGVADESWNISLQTDTSARAGKVGRQDGGWTFKVLSLGEEQS